MRVLHSTFSASWTTVLCRTNCLTLSVEYFKITLCKLLLPGLLINMFGSKCWPWSSQSASTALQANSNQPNSNQPDSQKKEIYSGNLIIPGWYADPDNHVFENQYWVFPSLSLEYDQQTYFDCFSSPGLITWTNHERILDFADIP